MWIKRFLICVSSLALAFLVLLIVLFFGGALELKDFLICLATLFSALGSLALGGVSIYNEKKATELTNELQSEKERNRVRPILRISINKINDEYKLKISNDSIHPAINVFFFDYFVSSIIRKNDVKILDLTSQIIDEYCPHDVYKEYYPSEINMFYTDEQYRNIHQLYRLRKNDLVYESSSEDIDYL